jgi:hypothetical protein
MAALMEADAAGGGDAAPSSCACRLRSDEHGAAFWDALAEVVEDIASDKLVRKWGMTSLPETSARG